MEILEEKSNKNEVVEAYRTSQGLTFQVITKTAFAMDVDCQRDENASAFIQFSSVILYSVVYGSVQIFLRKEKKQLLSHVVQLHTWI